MIRVDKACLAWLTWLMPAVCACCSGLLSVPVLAQSNDWTQWGGPHRNFIVEAKGLATAWPEKGPNQLWKRDLGEGYSAIAAEGGRLYTMYQRGEEEVVIALDAATGKTLWEHPYHAPITANMTNAPGPRATPLVVGNWLYTAGATGKLHCLDKRSGKVVWSHDLFNEYKGYVQDEYYAASPLAYKNMIIVPVGAAGASIVAFDQKTGAVVWKKQDFKTSYASPILIKVDGQEQVVLMMESEIIGVEPNTGELLWSHPHQNRTKTNVSTPFWGADNLLFCSSAYDSGGRMLKLSVVGGKTKVEELWFQKKLRIHVANVIRLGEIIYGSSGDFGPAPFTAVNVKTGEVIWQERNLPKTSFIYADGRFIMLNEDGELILATPTATGLKIHSRVPLLTQTSWTPPTLAASRLYLRDRKTILALDLN
jgi:outer membrane protein assembly factor BamB